MSRHWWAQGGSESLLAVHPGTPVPTGACFTWVTIFESLSLSSIWTLKITMSDCRQIAEPSPCYALSFCPLFLLCCFLLWGTSLVAQTVMNLPPIRRPWFEPWVSPRKGNGNHSSILAWRIPWTEEPGGLQCMGLQRVRQD